MSPTKISSLAPATGLRGFSLVEMMVAMSIGAFVIAGVVSSYVFLGRNLIRFSNQQQLAAQIQRTLPIFAQDVHAATGVTSFSGTQLVLSLPNSCTVTYVFSSTAAPPYLPWTLVRTVTGTPPSGIASAPSLTLLSGVSVAGNSLFSYYDQFDVAATNTLGIKKIEINPFTLTIGTASAGTQVTSTAASARLILRGKHLVTY